MELFNSLKDSFYENFIVDDRWKYLTEGLKNTLLITILAILIGIILGFIVAIIRATHDKTGKMKILNFFAKIYHI